MESFSMKIAGVALEVRPLFASTRHYCGKYLTEEFPEITISVTQADLDREQALLLEEALREGIKPRVFQEPFLERNFIQRRLAEELLSRDILLLHGSALAVDGEGYLFTANCGTGKSTHTRLWRQVFGDRAVMVNDDKPFLRLEAEGVLLCGSPWSGKHGLDNNLTVPLRGICILERGAENKIQSLSPAEALPMLRKQGGAPEGEEKLECYEELVQRLSRSVKLWKMECTKEPQAAEVAYAAMAQS